MNSEKPSQSDLIRLTIDEKEISVVKGTTVYHAAKQAGIEIPIFCYHDRMPPFGACRMCLVEVEKFPRLQTSCTLEVAEGMSVKTKTSKAIDGQEEILEFLLINHPLDCPICDRGGECPLQEHVFHHGPGESRFFEEKRHFKKPWPLGPVLMLDRERCIVCARCTRFSDLIAGDGALRLLDRGFKTEVGTIDGGPANSKFIGNTIMICPVGALTSQVYRFRARPWDNEPTETSCTLCPVGCSMILDSRDGEIMRTRSMENQFVNDIWLCDKGWFGYEFVENSNRLQTPLIKKNGKLIPASWDEALSLISNKIKEAESTQKLAGWGGNPLTFEENYLFQKLFREVCHVNNVDHRIGSPLFFIEEEGINPGMEITIQECETLSFAVFFGLDLTEEFPVIWLRIKQAINRGLKVYFFGHYAPEIASHLTKTILHSPGNEVETIQRYASQIESLSENKERGAFFVGSQYLNHPNRSAILSELMLIQKNIPSCSLNILEGRENSIGARLAGMHPQLGPFHAHLDSIGLNALEVLHEGIENGWDFLWVAGANPARKFSLDRWQKFRSQLKCLVVQDLFLTETAKQADIVLPTLSFVEKGGSFINIEGRVQTILPGKTIPGSLLSDKEIFIRVAESLGQPLTIDSLFLNQLKTKKFSLKDPINSTQKSSHPSQNHQEPGALFVTFSQILFDQGVRMKHNSHLIKLAKNPGVRVNGQEGIKRKIKNGEIVRLIHNEKTLEVPLILDDRVAIGTIVLPLNFDDIPVQDLTNDLMNGFPIQILKKEA